MDALRSFEGSNLLLSSANAKLTTAAITLTTQNAIGGTNAANAIIDGVFLPNPLAAAAYYPAYVANDGVSLLGTPLFPSAPLLQINAGITQNGQANVGAYGQAAVVAFGIQLYRTLNPSAATINGNQPGQPLTIQQAFQPGSSQLDNGGGVLNTFGLTGVAIGASGAITFTSPGTAASGAPQIQLGQLVQVTGTNTGTGTLAAGTYLAGASASQTGVTLWNLLTGAAATTSAGTSVGQTFTVINTTASLQSMISAIVGPVVNVDKNGTALNPFVEAFPNIPDNFVLIGYADVYNPYNSATPTFTFGTNNWNAPGVQSTFFNAAAISKRSRQQFA